MILSWETRARIMVTFGTPLRNLRWASHTNWFNLSVLFSDLSRKYIQCMWIQICHNRMLKFHMEVLMWFNLILSGSYRFLICYEKPLWYYGAIGLLCWLYYGQFGYRWFLGKLNHTRRWKMTATKPWMKVMLQIKP